MQELVLPRAGGGVIILEVSECVTSPRQAQEFQ